MDRHFAVFVNAAAGSVNETDQQVDELTRLFAENAVHAAVQAIDPEALPDSIHRTWEAGIDAIVVAGGDGSVNCAAGVAAGTDIVLGVLPMGTFNHFAKDLGVPANDIPAAVAWLARAAATPIDIGEVNGSVFVNNASIGVYPKMVLDRDAIRERRGWGKIRAVPVAVVRTLWSLPVHRLRLRVDGGRPTDIATPFLFVGNGLFDAHGQRLGRRTSLTDHRLSVYSIATTRRWRLIAQAIAAKVRGIQANSRTDRRSATTLVVDSLDTNLSIALDGEPTELRVPLEFRCRPGELRVLAAADQPS